MLSIVLVVMLVLALGSAVADQVRLKQEEIILRKLPLEEARAFYQVLRRRAWKVRVLRAIALASVLAIFLTYKNRLAQQVPAPAVPAATQPATPPP